MENKKMKVEIIDEKTGKKVFNGKYSYSELEKENRETTFFIVVNGKETDLDIKFTCNKEELKDLIDSLQFYLNKEED